MTRLAAEQRILLLAYATRDNVDKRQRDGRFSTYLGSN